MEIESKIKKILCPQGKDYLESKRKRAMDIIGMTALLPVLLPLGFVVATLIKLDDGGPVFYIAKVPGKEGEEFGMIKFRTMKENSADEDNLFPKKPGDKRITRIGAFLRKSSLDEIPNAINVFKGEMSIVGHRPMFTTRIEAINADANLQSLSPEWIRAVYDTKPGLIDLTTGRRGGELDLSIQGLRRRMRYEMFSINHASAGLDTKIFWEALKARIGGRGAF